MDKTTYEVGEVWLDPDGTHLEIVNRDYFLFQGEKHYMLKVRIVYPDSFKIHETEQGRVVTKAEKDFIKVIEARKLTLIGNQLLS